MARGEGKTRADLEPATPDRIINITDILFGLTGFGGIPYPFEPTELLNCGD